MLDPKIETCLNVIRDKRPIHNFIKGMPYRERKEYYVSFARRDDDWCTAYNHLLTSLAYHQPARTMLEFGKSSLSRSTTLSWKKRIAWLRRYCDKYDVKFCGSKSKAFRKWSKAITLEVKTSKAIYRNTESVGPRIAHRMEHERRMDGYSAYSRGRRDG